MSREYLSVADTAKLVRKALKESFPGVKFSVRSKSYSMGASINIGWTDGPNARQVEQVANAFEGSYFDGMTDYKGNNYHALDGKPVMFGADFVFANREHSDAGIARAIRTLAARYPGNFAIVADKVSVEAYRSGNLWNVNDGLLGDSYQTLLNVELSKQSDRLAASPSATLDRIRFRGDDGYGYGATGKVKPELKVIQGGVA